MASIAFFTKFSMTQPNNSLFMFAVISALEVVKLNSICLEVLEDK